ncbi:MAG: permease-like cell division protein FtsX [Bacteroidaceae bacterium]|nr:permease-like cell division protein FtsX [Bacteroidaceae bacterium]
MKKKYKASVSVHLGMQGVTSGISITLVLLLIGTIVMSLLTAHNLSQFVRENISFSIYVDPDMKEAELIKMQTELRKEPFVKQLTYISADQALREQSKELGIDAREFLGYNPYTPMLEVQLTANYANPDSLSIIEKRIKKRTQIAEVVYQKELVKSVNHNIQFIAIVLGALAALFALISFALINNTMRLAVFSQRFLIYTMYLVGASWGFIRKPFLIRCIVIGLLAGVIASCILMGGAIWLLNYEPELSCIISPEILLIVCGSVLGSGIFITGFAGLLSINHFLKMKNNQMFHN